MHHCCYLYERRGAFLFFYFFFQKRYLHSARVKEWLDTEEKTAYEISNASRQRTTERRVIYIERKNKRHNVDGKCIESVFYNWASILEFYSQENEVSARQLNRNK